MEGAGSSHKKCTASPAGCCGTNYKVLGEAFMSSFLKCDVYSFGTCSKEKPGSVGPVGFQGVTRLCGQNESRLCFSKPFYVLLQGSECFGLWNIDGLWQRELLDPGGCMWTLAHCSWGRCP